MMCSQVLPSHASIGFRIPGAEGGLLLLDAVLSEFAASDTCVRGINHRCRCQSVQSVRRRRFDAPIIDHLRNSG
jgi:hypothetical protein